MTLEQVLVMSRHNLRTPIVNTGILTEITDKTWPAWDAQSGYLTTKGGALEVYMGHYFREWLDENKLLPDTLCPTGEKELNVYANSLQRTIATAQFFTAGAFLAVQSPSITSRKSAPWTRCLTRSLPMTAQSSNRPLSRQWRAIIKGWI